MKYIKEINGIVLADWENELTMIGFSPPSLFDGSKEIFGTARFLPDSHSLGVSSVLKPLVSGNMSA